MSAASSRRRLVSGVDRRIEASSPIRREGLTTSTAARDSPATTRQYADLPAYQPPEFPLSADGKRALEVLTTDRLGADRYKEHLARALKNIPGHTADSCDRAYTRKLRAEKLRMKIQKRVNRGEQGEQEEGDDGADVENEGTAMTSTEETILRDAVALEQHVEELTKQSEKAMRDLIDWQVELNEQETIFKSVADNIAIAPLPTTINLASNRPARRRQRVDEDSDDDEGSDYQEDLTNDGFNNGNVAERADILSPTELWQKAKEQHSAAYRATSLRSRYAEDNDYKSFKRLIHDSYYPEKEAPPVPHASTWFNEDSNAVGQRQLRGRQEHPDDDDIMVTSETSNLICPLTLRVFVEPYSNHACKHTFEKSAILEFHGQNAVAFVDAAQRRKRGQAVALGPKRLKCPATGCDAMIEEKDFYLDTLIQRKIKRAAASAAIENDDDEGQSPPRGSQINRPEEIDEENIYGDFADIDNEEERRRTITRLKSERMSTGPSQSGRNEVFGNGDVDMED